jgi:NAD(P)H-hydrate epimerase
MPPQDLVFDRDAVRAVDHAAIEEYGIPGIVLMENAARGAADAAATMLTPVENARVLIACGSGNNGGDGYAMARQLHNRGARVMLIPLGDPMPGTDAAINYDICRRMRLPMLALTEAAAQPRFDLIVDAIFGTGLDRPVIGAAAEAIHWINTAGSPVLALDLPSGLDANTGEPLGVAVRAAVTVTFVGVKVGFLRPIAREYVGDAVVAEIGAPVEAVRRFGQLRKTASG